MGLISAENTPQLCCNCWNIPFCVALLFAVGLIGCTNTCFTFTSNPPTGTINIKAGDPTPACTLTKANGAVRLVLKAVPMCNYCSESSRIQHIFVSIRGIDVTSSSIADEESPDWQNLAPQLAKQPLQVDLVRDTADRSAGEPLGEIVTVPAGVYRQLRVRFLPDPLAAEDQLPEKNACGNTGFNCVVMTDGRVQRLQLDGRSPELRIMSDRIEGGSLFLPSGTDSDLVIELKPVWAWFSSTDDGVRLLPALTGKAKVGRIEFDELGSLER